MNALKIIILGVTLCFTSTSNAQNAEEIIETYIENIGGQDAWGKINSMTVTGIGRQQGVDYPFVATFMKDGRTHIDVNIQGASFIIEAFDGETSWTMNFQTQQPEASDTESSINYKNDAKDNVPSAFYNYKAKGYTAELVGTEAFEGTECYKIKLIKTPVLVDGKEEENIDIYYFDTENNVPIAMESIIKSGQAKGATAQSLFSDYQEVDGLYIAFSQIDKFNGQVGLTMTYKGISFNTEVDDAIFKMPADSPVKKN